MVGPAPANEEVFVVYSCLSNHLNDAPKLPCIIAILLSHRRKRITDHCDVYAQPYLFLYLLRFLDLFSSFLRPESSSDRRQGINAQSPPVPYLTVACDKSLSSDLHDLLVIAARFYCIKYSTATSGFYKSQFCDDSLPTI